MTKEMEYLSKLVCISKRLDDVRNDLDQLLIRDEKGLQLIDSDARTYALAGSSDVDSAVANLTQSIGILSARCCFDFFDKFLFDIESKK